MPFLDLFPLRRHNLLSSYLVIEEKRQEILTIMISLLANSEELEELTLGYLNVQAQQKKELTNWLHMTMGDSETYCGLFVYHKTIWSGKEEQMEDTINLINHSAPNLQYLINQCSKQLCKLTLNYLCNENKLFKLENILTNRKKT